MAKKLKDLNEVSHAIIDMLSKTPEVKSKSDKYPNQHSGLYSQAAIIGFLEDKYTSLKVVQALNDLQNCPDVKIDTKMVKNFFYEMTNPFFYTDNNGDMEVIKAEYENWSKKQAMPYILKREELKKKAAKVKKRKVSQKQLDALARARAARKAKKEQKIY